LTLSKRYLVCAKDNKVEVHVFFFGEGQKFLLVKGFKTVVEGSLDQINHVVVWEDIFATLHQ
jgi:hypothetical protein